MRWIPVLDQNVAEILSSKNTLPWRFKNTIAARLFGQDHAKQVWSTCFNGRLWWLKSGIFAALFAFAMIGSILGMFLLIDPVVMIISSVYVILVLTCIGIYASDVCIQCILMRGGTFWAQVTLAVAGAIGLMFIVNFDFRISMAFVHMAIVTASAGFDSVSPRIRIVLGPFSLVFLILFTFGAIVVLNLGRLPGELNVTGIDLGLLGGLAAQPVIINPVQLATDATVGLLFFLVRSLAFLRHPHTMYVVNVDIESEADEFFDPMHELTRLSDCFRVVSSRVQRQSFVA